MEDKLTRMRDLLEQVCDMRDASPSSFTQSLEVQNIAEDIIHKLSLMKKKMMERSARSSRSKLSSSLSISSNDDRIFMSLDASRKLSNLSSLSTNGSFVTYATLNGGPEQAAKEAYDRGQFALCVRIVEKMLKEEQAINREMFHLCHDSYKKNVEEGIEVHKFCEWWKRFLENVVIMDAGFDDEIELSDCQTECLWECQMLSNSEAERLDLITRIMNLQINAYEETTVRFRRFHTKCLRRIRKICSFIENFFEEYPVQANMPPCIEEGLEISRIGVSDAKVDAKQYARETGATGDKAYDDICYIESTELIKEVDMVLYKYLYCELVHSDTESDCFISSEESQDNLKDEDDLAVAEFSETTTLNEKFVEDTVSDENENCITRL